LKQNITLSLDKELIKKAKILAAQRQMSISHMLSEELKKIIEDAEIYEYSKKRAFELISTGFHMGEKTPFTREDLHGR